MNTPNLYETLKEYDLLKTYSYILQNNQSNNLPYHNFGHLENVTLFSFLGCQYYELNKDITKNILFAALFHDFNHSGGKLKDIENIALAKEGLKNYLEIYKDEDIKVDFVNYLIDITEFPYTTETDKLTIFQKILRDSDLLQSFFINNYMQDVVLGLAKEMNRTPAEAINGQILFLNNLKFGTEWANEMFYKKKTDILNNLELIKINLTS